MVDWYGWVDVYTLRIVPLDTFFSVIFQYKKNINKEEGKDEDKE